MSDLAKFLSYHTEQSRRFFLKAGLGASVTLSLRSVLHEAAAEDTPLDEALATLESYFTKQDDFRDVSRGKPVPHSLSDEEKTAAGITRDTWKLEVVSDSEHKANLRKPMTAENGTAFEFKDLMDLAKVHAVRFPKVMTCLNIGCPLGMGIWEGVPLREVFWLTQPRRDIRRVFYYGYHNKDPKQMFRSSLPIDRILEDPDDLPPVILCYKLNGQWLTSERGGPVRVVVPEGYGFKSIKWLSHVVISNLYHANDTYANGNNDVDSRLKSFAATLSYPKECKPSQPIPITGYAQSGIAGLRKVQVWMHRDSDPLPKNDPYFLQAPWRDATVLPPPADWGGELPDNTIPAETMGFDEEGKPEQWPMRLAKAHWAYLHDGLPAGEYTLRCRTIDEKGKPQPLPRPFRKSGHAAIEQMPVLVEA